MGVAVANTVQHTGGSEDILDDVIQVRKATPLSLAFMRVMNVFLEFVILFGLTCILNLFKYLIFKRINDLIYTFIQLNLYHYFFFI